MTYIKVTDFDKHEVNPFMEKALEDIVKHRVRRYKRVNAKGSLTKEAAQIVVNGDGEPLAYGSFMEYVVLDEKQFTKVYLKEMAIFWELNKAGQKVLMYILSNLKPNSDLVLFSMEKCLDFTGYKHKKNVIEGIGNLLSKDVIAKSIYETAFFINPMILFNGDRITFAKTFIKKKKANGDKDQLDVFEDNLK